MIQMIDAQELFDRLVARRGHRQNGLLSLADVREFVEGVAFTIERLPAVDGVMSALQGRRLGARPATMHEIVDFDATRVGGRLPFRAWRREWPGPLPSWPFCSVTPSRVLDPPALRDELRARGWVARGGLWWPPA